MKRFITMLLLVLAVVCIGCDRTCEATSVELQEPYDGLGVYDRIQMLELKLPARERAREAAHDLADSARRLGYSDDHEFILVAKQEYENANNDVRAAEATLQALKDNWSLKEEEYPAATFIWKYLRDKGFSNPVCAGILGNIMAEVGGQTLDIQYMIESRSYQGMCQWAKRYSTLPSGAGLEEQCQYLVDTMEYQMNMFGFCYRKGFNYDEFVKMLDVREVALAFAKTYERCGSGSYSIRKTNAVVAYNYFMN